MIAATTSAAAAAVRAAGLARDELVIKPANHGEPRDQATHIRAITAPATHRTGKITMIDERIKFSVAIITQIFIEWHEYIVLLWNVCSRPWTILLRHSTRSVAPSPMFILDPRRHHQWSRRCVSHVMSSFDPGPYSAVRSGIDSLRVPAVRPSYLEVKASVWMESIGDPDRGK